MVDDIVPGASNISLSIVISEVNLDDSNSIKWRIDIGATWYVCSNKGLFILIDEIE